MEERKKSKERKEGSEIGTGFDFSYGKENLEVLHQRRWILMPLAPFRFAPLNFLVECIPKDSIITQEKSQKRDCDKIIM